MKHVLVTGGAGFLGSHLVDNLLEQGNRVYVIDNCQSGTAVNLQHHLQNSNFFFKQLDITKLKELHDNKITPKSFSETEDESCRFDQIYHMACSASPTFYQRDPVQTLMTNVMGTYNLLEIAVYNKSRFLITSTSEVYGDPLQHPQKETYWGNVNCTGIRACYDEGKRAAETLCFDYHRTRGLQIRVARIFNTYGPRMRLDDGRIISNFVRQALLSQPIAVYGNGSQTRSFCYVSDQIEGLQMLMNQEKTNGPVNIGNPVEHTVLEIAHQVQEIVGKEKIAVEFKELPSDDPKQRRPDITLAKEVLGWSPKVDLREGIKRTIAEFSGKIEKEVSTSSPNNSNIQRPE